MFYVYVLRNEVTGKFYKGQIITLQKRLIEHRQSHTKTTSNNSTFWELIYYEEVETRELALKREKYFKTSAGRRFLKSVLS